jgi:hypothetical protein
MKLPVIVVIAAAVALSRGQTTPSAPRATNTTPGLQTTHAVAFYDAALQRVVLVGGAEQPAAADRDHVWSWSGSGWHFVTTSGPPARGNAAAAYDAGRRLAIVAGGARRPASGPAMEIISDTWLGSVAGWQRLTGTEFDARDHQSMVYDESAQALLMFGGIPADRSASWPSDTWRLRDAGWQRIASEGPAGRGRTALVYDSQRRQVVLFGGVGASPGPGQPQPFFSDTWVWERERWREVATTGPRARYAHGMVFDERAGVVLLYSGAAAHKNAPLSDMWQWDGKQWTEIRLSGATPGYRYQPVMVYDRRRGKTVLYGGLQGSKDDTWEWDGRQWKQVHPD